MVCYTLIISMGLRKVITAIGCEHVLFPEVIFGFVAGPRESKAMK